MILFIIYYIEALMVLTFLKRFKFFDTLEQESPFS